MGGDDPTISSEESQRWIADDLGHIETGFTPEQLAPLIQKTFKSDQEWEALGLIPPSDDSDWAPGSLATRVQQILTSAQRVLRDSIFNIALLKQDWIEGKRWQINPGYEKKGTASNFLREVLTQWKPFVDLRYASAIRAAA